MNLSTEQRFDRISDGNLRLEAVVDLASAIATEQFESPDGAVDDLLQDIADESMQFPACNGIDDLVAVVRSHIGDEYEIGGVLLRRNTLGIAVKFATPTRDYTGDRRGDSYSFSWGSYYTTWVYADSYEQAWERGFEWVEAMKIKDREATR